MDLFLWAFVRAVPPASPALIIPLQANPMSRGFSKSPFDHECYTYSQVTVSTLSLELSFYYLHFTTRCFEPLAHCSPSKMVNSISFAFFLPLSVLSEALYLAGAQQPDGCANEFGRCLLHYVGRHQGRLDKSNQDNFLFHVEDPKSWGVKKQCSHTLSAHYMDFVK